MTLANNLHLMTPEDGHDLGAYGYEVFIGLRQSTSGDIIEVPPQIGKVVAK